MDSEKKYRMSKGSALLIVIATALVDIIQVIIDLLSVALGSVTSGAGIAAGQFLNKMIDLGMEYALWLYFKNRGISIFGGKNFLFSLGSLFAKFIPVVGDFPFFTLDVLWVLGTTFAEDSLHLKPQKSTGNPEIVNKSRAEQPSRINAARKGINLPGRGKIAS